MTSPYPTTERGWEDSMRHDVPRTSRRRTRWPISTKPGRCDDCGRERHPEIDHSNCPSEKRET